MAPVLGTVAAPIGELAPTVPYSEQKPRLIQYAGFTGIENIAGVPSIALPIGQSQDGLPVGIQFSAAPGAEPTLLALAYELERELLWYNRRPPRSEEHTSELQSLMRISYAGFCLKKKTQKYKT